MEASDLQRAPDAESSADVPTEREAARERLQVRRDFSGHLVAYLVVNAFLVAIWAMTGGGYFWPAWVLCSWGIGLVLHAWDAFVRRSITGSDVDAEVRRQR